ncbi:hypothetical protein T439DRAFT_382214 [Meredithblackwellia eburnea MCA 4105]
MNGPRSEYKLPTSPLPPLRHKKGIDALRVDPTERPTRMRLSLDTSGRPYTGSLLRHETKDFGDEPAEDDKQGPVRTHRKAEDTPRTAAPFVRPSPSRSRLVSTTSKVLNLVRGIPRLSRDDDSVVGTPGSISHSAGLRVLAVTTAREDRHRWHGELSGPTLWIINIEGTKMNGREDIVMFPEEDPTLSKEEFEERQNEMSRKIGRNTVTYGWHKCVRGADDESSSQKGVLAQASRYYAGVATKDWNWKKSVFEYATGGLKAAVSGNTVDAIIAEIFFDLVKVFKSGDQIALFGFSRGAYICRILAQVIAYFGCEFKEDETRVEEVRQELRTMREKDFLSSGKKNPIEKFDVKQRIRVMGVFDTVAGQGIPDRANSDKHTMFSFPSKVVGSSYVDKAFHIFAIDENNPALCLLPMEQPQWERKDKIHPCFTQIGMEGVHGSVGNNGVRARWAMAVMADLVSGDHKDGKPFLRVNKKMICGYATHIRPAIRLSPWFYLHSSPFYPSTLKSPFGQIRTLPTNLEHTPPTTFIHKDVQVELGFKYVASRALRLKRTDKWIASMKGEMEKDVKGQAKEVTDDKSQATKATTKVTKFVYQWRVPFEPTEDVSDASPSAFIYEPGPTEERMKKLYNSRIQQYLKKYGIIDKDEPEDSTHVPDSAIDERVRQLYKVHREHRERGPSNVNKDAWDTDSGDDEGDKPDRPLRPRRVLSHILVDGVGGGPRRKRESGPPKSAAPSSRRGSVTAAFFKRSSVRGDTSGAPTPTNDTPLDLSFRRFRRPRRESVN